MAGTKKTNEEYAVLFGGWVTARILERVKFKQAQDPEYQLPAYVTDFIDGVANPNGSKPAPCDAFGWLIKSVDKPDWPERE